MARSSGTTEQPLVSVSEISKINLEEYVKNTIGDNVPPTVKKYLESYGSLNQELDARQIKKLQKDIAKIKLENKKRICNGKFFKHRMIHDNLRCYCKECGFCPLGVMEPRTQ